MNLVQQLMEKEEYFAAGAYEEPGETLFVRKSLGIRNWLKNRPLAEYHGEYLYPSGIYSGLDYLTNLNFRDRKALSPELQAEIDADFGRYHSHVAKEHVVAGNMYTHSLPHYERILQEGFLGYRERVSRMQNENMKKGLLAVLDGIEAYLGRCTVYLRSVGAREELIAALEAVPMHPAQDLYQAIVAWNFVLYLDDCDNLGCLVSGLKPYYHGEDATEWLQNLFANLDENNGYSMAMGPEDHPLLRQCLEAARGRRRPMIELMVTPETPDEVWSKAFEVVRTTGGQPAFYNYNVLMEGFKERFPEIPDADLQKFCGVGCAEASLAGLTNAGSLDAGINLIYVLSNCIREELPRCRTFSGFLTRYLGRVKQTVIDVAGQIRLSQKERAEYNPLPMRTLLVDDCIQNEQDFNCGGARYSWSNVNIAGLVNVVDSLLSIKKFVFEDKTYTKQAFVSLLDANDEALLNACRRNPVCHGVDDEGANNLCYQVSHTVFSVLEKQKTHYGLGFLPASIQFMDYERAGSYVDATPDGRRKGAPIADSLAPIFRKDVPGPTAALNSITSFDLKKAIGTPVVNFTVNPDFSDAILKALILGYQASGGIQLQISCVSREMLEDAYRNPELYPNLVVRVGGYSEYFCRLSDELKRAVIERTIHNCRRM